MTHEYDEKTGKHTLTYECQCSACKGTGLYVGFAEKDGAAVVCHTCKGTGRLTPTVTWQDFRGKLIRDNVGLVLQTNPGIGVANASDGSCLVVKDFGGMLYSDWFAGKPFPLGSEMRKYSCPAWWYQCAEYDKKPKWDECIGCGSFSGCKHFANKEECWKRFDSESPDEVAKMKAENKGE